MKPKNPELGNIHTNFIRAVAPALTFAFLAACGGRVESYYAISHNQIPTPDVPTTIYSLTNFWVEPPFHGASQSVSCDVVTDSSVNYDVVGVGIDTDGVLNISVGDIRFPANREVCDQLQEVSGPVVLSQQGGLVTQAK